MKIAPKEEINTDLVKRLEQWLELARSGEIIAAAGVGIMTGRRMIDFTSNVEGGWQTFAIAGGLNGLAGTMMLLSLADAQRGK